jgi:di- and tripeptidase/Cys-Gly metallodipeptidase DUG1
VAAVMRAGVFNEPLSDLLKVLASLVDSENHILVPGFHDLVRPNTLAPALARLTTSSEFSLEGYRSALGIPRLVRPSPPRHTAYTWWQGPCRTQPALRRACSLLPACGAREA